jgi:hypothetical protein
MRLINKENMIIFHSHILILKSILIRMRRGRNTRFFGGVRVPSDSYLSVSDALRARGLRRGPRRRLFFLQLGSLSNSRPWHWMHLEPGRYLQELSRRLRRDAAIPIPPRKGWTHPGPQAQVGSS